MEISKKAIAKEHLKKEGWYDYEKGTEFKVLMQMPNLTHVQDWLGFTHWIKNEYLLVIKEEQNTSFEEDKVTHAIHRPKTRGELYQCLKNGIKCEVVASNEEFTSLALQSISITQKSDLKFKTTKSENAGWVIYELIQIKKMETAKIIIKPSWGETLELFQKNGAIRISSSDAETFTNLLNSINLKYITEEDEERKLTRFILSANKGA